MGILKTRFTGMDQVWLLFHSLELTATIMSFAFHVIGTVANEPFPHTMVCCGIYFVFLIYEFIDVTRILTGGFASYLFLFIIELLATCSFFIAAMVCMHFVENDIHLQYIDAKQEDNHPFFKYSKSQSVTSICACSFHLLHSCLLIDVYASYDFMTNSDFEEDGLGRLLKRHSRRKAIVPSKKTMKARLSSPAESRPSNRINESIEFAQRAIVLALCHQRFEPFDALQEKLKTCCKWRERQLFKLSLMENKANDMKSFQQSGASVRFTGFY